MPDGGLCRVIVVLDVFLIICSSFLACSSAAPFRLVLLQLLFGLFVCSFFFSLLVCSSFLACSSAIAFHISLQWLGHQVKVIWYPSSWRAARWIRMSLSLALLRGIAGWRFAIQSRVDWLSLTIQTFLDGFSVWIICNAYLIAFISA